jgi:glutamyl-tRNA(Gln) amidotransferase subunit E
MKIGFEIHQQLDTNKLFCSSPSILREEDAEYELMRRLRPSQSELGLVDEAAMKEFLKGKGFVYKGYNDSICLVELDEEPPRGPNDEAVKIGLTIALILKAKIVDEIHFMRKMVIDGSNTSGFQRTAIIAYDGYMDTDEGRIHIPTICLEEEAARKLEAEEQITTYNLDRLGIPLVEITTAPDIKSPKQARDAALKVGELLRSMGRVKRGIGTIRQDINVSIPNGSRAEIKGVQDLNMIPKLIENEVERQKGLLEIGDKLRKRKIKKESVKSKIFDVTGFFKNSGSTIISSKIKKEGRVLAIKLSGFEGLLGGGLLGREMALYVRVHTGLRGIFHSDELPSQGISDDEIKRVKLALNIKKGDAFVLVAAEEKKAKSALGVVLERARKALHGPLGETRMSRGGKSDYMRPLPGSARMYPETDILPYVVSSKLLKEIKNNLPESFDERAIRLASETKIGLEQAKQLARKSEGVWKDFELIAPTLKNISSSGAASIYLEWAKDVEKGIIKPEDPGFFVKAVDTGKVSKEAGTFILEEVREGMTIEDAIKKIGSKPVDVEEIVDRLIIEKSEFISNKGLFAAKPLMGLVMKEARGKVDGRIVSEVVNRKLNEFLSKS